MLKVKVLLEELKDCTKAFDVTPVPTMVLPGPIEPEVILTTAVAELLVGKGIVASAVNGVISELDTLSKGCDCVGAVKLDLVILLNSLELTN